MNLRHTSAALLLAVFFVAAHADDGHDHGAAPSAASGPALPRFAAVSESFELVGVLDGKRITLYLDRYADNAPVPGATIELDLAGTKATAERHGDDYEVTLAEAPKPGVLPITATVTAGSEVDLLAGELDLHEAAHVDAPAAAGWKARAPWILGGLAALALAVVAVRRVAASRSPRHGGAA